MEAEGSILHLQVPATCPYPESDHSTPCPPSHFLKIHLNIIVPSMPGSSRWSLSLRFRHQNPVYTSPLPHTCYVLRHIILLDLITQKIFGEEYRSLSSSLCSFLHSLLGPNILLSTLFSNTLGLHSFLSVSDRVSRPYKTRGKLIFVYIVIFLYLDSKLKDKRSCNK